MRPVICYTLSHMRPETKQLLKNISIGLGVFLLVGLVLYGVWQGTRADFATINTVEVSGGETISHDRVRTEVAALLAGEYVGFIQTVCVDLPQKRNNRHVTGNS